MTNCKDCLSGEFSWSPVMGRDGECIASCADGPADAPCYSPEYSDPYDCPVAASDMTNCKDCLSGEFSWSPVMGRDGKCIASCADGPADAPCYSPTYSNPSDCPATATASDMKNC